MSENRICTIKMTEEQATKVFEELADKKDHLGNDIYTTEMNAIQAAIDIEVKVKVEYDEPIDAVGCTLSISVDQANKLAVFLDAFTEKGFDTEIPEVDELISRLYHIASVEAPTYFVNVYEEVQCYGGPEEGGWYYHTRECIDSEAFVALESAFEHIRNYVYDEYDLDTSKRLSKEELIECWNSHAKEGHYCMYICDTDRYGEGYIVAIELEPSMTQNMGRQHYE